MRLFFMGALDSGQRESSAVLLWAAVLVLFFPNKLFADVYSYECNVLPEHPSAGWTLIQAFCGPEQWIEDETLVQEVLMCDEFPGEGQQFDYTRDIEILEDLTTWFIEWRVMTTGISEEIAFTAPAHLVAFAGGSIVYHFTIADDTVRFIRDSNMPTLFFDIGPGPHVYRVELFGEGVGESYVVYIDGEIVDNGEAEGPLFNPPWQAGVNFRAKAKFVPSQITWSYIRWGRLQEQGGGDFTDDGEINSDDVPFFHECLSGPQGGWPGCAWADMNFDGETTCEDWELFLDAWTDPKVEPPCAEGCDCPVLDIRGDGQDLSGAHVPDAAE